MNKESDKFECKFCGHQFNFKEEMKEHAMKTHPEKMEK